MLWWSVHFCLFLVTLVVFVCWSRLRRPTFQRRKVGKVRRACGPGPGVGGRRNRYGACKSFGCYPPFKPPPSILRPLAPRADIPLAKLVSSCPAFGCTHAAFRTTNLYKMDLGSSRCGNVGGSFPHFTEVCAKLKALKALNALKALKGAKSKGSTERKEENTRRLNPKAIL